MATGQWCNYPHHKQQIPDVQHKHSNQNANEHISVFQGTSRMGTGNV